MHPQTPSWQVISIFPDQPDSETKTKEFKYPFLPTFLSKLFLMIPYYNRTIHSNKQKLHIYTTPPGSYKILILQEPYKTRVSIPADAALQEPYIL